MPEVIHPAKLINEFASLIAKDLGFLISSESLKKVMNVKRDTRYWLNHINSELYNHQLYIGYFDDEYKDLLVFRHPKNIVKANNGISGNNGLERMIGFIRDQFEMYPNGFGFGRKDMRTVYQDGYFTQPIIQEINEIIKPIGNILVSPTFSARLNIFNLIHMYDTKARTIESMERDILHFKTEQEINSRKSEQLQAEDLSIESINWTMLDNINKHQNQHNGIELIDSTYSIANENIRVTNQNMHHIQAGELYEVTNYLSHNISNDQIPDTYYGEISFIDEDSDKNLCNDELSFYIPFHTQKIHPSRNGLNWGIYINLGMFFSTAMCFTRTEDENKSRSRWTEKELSKEKHKSLYWNLYALFHRNYFKYQVESLSSWLEYISYSLDDKRALYKDFYTNITQLHSSNNLEELAADYYCLSSLKRMPADDDDRHDLEEYRQDMRNYRANIVNAHHISYDKYNINDSDMSQDKKASLAKMALAKSILGLDVQNDSQLSIISRYVINGHATPHKRKDIPLYVLGNQDQIDIFNILFPAAKILITTQTYPSSMFEKEEKPLNEIINGI